MHYQRVEFIMTHLVSDLVNSVGIGILFLDPLEHVLRQISNTVAWPGTTAVWILALVAGTKDPFLPQKARRNLDWRDSLPLEKVEPANLQNVRQSSASTQK